MRKRNRLRATQVLGIGKTSLYRYLKQDGYVQAAIARTEIGERSREFRSRIRNPASAAARIERHRHQASGH